ncbi:tetratricopeptide repeat protein [Hydromonas duriensis]|uniref:Anaphase-promoting complex subunit 3 n=1 Tax=Hydromonas duriensis TaxID=1527608 RepID=A0A4R6Y4E5_9BURK|nr:anaphase-promoting complex subunit 3 [Hydromonas duriensis]
MLQQGRIEDAIFVFNEASKRGSENAEILCNLAYAYYQHEDIEKAIPYLNRALNLKPKRGSSLLLAGQIFAKLGEQQKAISYFESYLYYSSNRKAAVEQLIQWSNGFEDGRNLVLRESAKQALMNAGYNNLE